MSEYIESTSRATHEHWMMMALEQAYLAKAKNEVPVGAVLVDCDSKELIADAHNESIGNNDPTAHAEIVVIRKAAAIRQNYRLPRTAIYVTIEPCTMCVGAMYHARVDAVIFGANEPKAGALVSQLCLSDKSFYNRDIGVLGGILEYQCATLISDFFRDKRSGLK